MWRNVIRKELEDHTKRSANVAHLWNILYFYPVFLKNTEEEKRRKFHNETINETLLSYTCLHVMVLFIAWLCGLLFFDKYLL